MILLKLKGISNITSNLKSIVDIISKLMVNNFVDS